ncbi:hypothetical protein MSAN_02419900 [Mycena sanguinolenta]|uniref:Uncharacterized protein n=1 Tax=Mycena sanguinolenta TaxID=230812 RepID=A0A8H7CDU5_9AGAR|nr:hypothetical protein MSAN_02419900 [Mycena sanguinolenta]
MPLSNAQLSAVYEAKKILAEVGLTTVPTTSDDHRNYLDVSRIISEALPTSDSTCAAVSGSLYRPLPARPFTEEELQQSLNYINRQTSVHRLVEHPLGAIVEYPETGNSTGVGIAHRFYINAGKCYAPHENFQYSLGDSRGGEQDALCGNLLLGRDGTPAFCSHKRRACKGLKYCSARSSYVLPPLKLNSLAEAKREVFLKTLAFYCTLVEKGCAFDIRADTESLGLTHLDDDGNESESDKSESNDSDEETGTNVLRDSRRKAASRFSCKGKLKLSHDEYHRAFIQYILPLILALESNIQSDALLENDTKVIHEREELARQFGYRPLALCEFSASPSAQKQLCPYWHQSVSGKLAHGTLEREPGNYPATFDIYTPHDLANFKTPPPLLEVFRTLLLELDWKLADVTPRKLMLDSGFMASFRRILGWEKRFDPPIDALHLSFGNLEHVRRYIDELRHCLFPDGTGFEGAQLLAKQHQELPEEEQYVRCAETYTLEDGNTFHLVICMLRVMSELLMRSKTLSLDTAFKRVSGKWQEFEMERWDIDNMKSIVGTRAFTTSQSTEAHLILFTRIFEIASADTGIPCHFRHIHGDGFELWITDAHKGQALGTLCAQLGDIYCPMEPTRLLRTLDPYDHLRRFLRLCTVHNKRNIDKLKPYTTRKVHPDLEGAFKVIESGGRKAKAWLKDKQIGSKFSIPALYQPASLIPLEIWKSGSSTTNGNEQSHRNINRDGVNLTMLGGIMRGMQYDVRAMGALDLHASRGIYSSCRHGLRPMKPSRTKKIVLFQLIRKFTGQQLLLISRTPFALPHIYPRQPRTSPYSLRYLSLPSQYVGPTASWYDEQMQLDTPQTQAPYIPSADFFAVGNNDLPSQDSMREYLATYGFPSAPFYPCDIDTTLAYENLETPSLHILQFGHLPSDPLPPSPRALRYYNR